MTAILVAATLAHGFPVSLQYIGKRGKTDDSRSTSSMGDANANGEKDETRENLVDYVNASNPSSIPLFQPPPQLIARACDILSHAHNYYPAILQG
ncbi:hypothetical protein DXG03_008445 [Asterophora parasitica]|uniref:Uncharacterized protein n=1 Tax=Asterophora parasitica TaxID=117018 RepID=A0A9P7GIK6_9AGAR|nr:hypothetical protein DXG03_008445 [Asterophora parasitica]